MTVEKPALCSVRGTVRHVVPSHGGVGSWAFPDLAIIDLDTPIGSLLGAPTGALLGTDDIQPFDQLVAACFDPRSPFEPDAVLVLLRLESTGSYGSYVRAVGDVVVRGMSGGPVLDMARGLVCGVLKATTDALTGDGGIFVPVTALQEALPTVLANNRRAHIGRSDWWHTASRFGQLRREMFEPIATPHERQLLPARWLVAAERLVPFLPSPVFAGLVDWCLAGAGQAPVRLLHGGGGTGKTRMALELADYLTGRGWLAGLLRPDADLSSVRAIVADGHRALLIVDYADTRAPQVWDLIEDVFETEGADVRVLLLGRYPGPWWTELYERLLGRGQDLLGIPMAAPALHEWIAPELLVERAFRAFRAERLRHEPDAAVPEALAEPVQHSAVAASDPLLATAYALDAVLGGGTTGPGADDRPLRRILFREVEYYRSALVAHRIQLSGRPAELATLLIPTLLPNCDEALAGRIAAAVCAATGASEDDGTTVVAVLRSLYPSRQYLWSPIEPDRVGEALLTLVAALPTADGVTDALLISLTVDRARRLLTVLCRALGLHLATPDAAAGASAERHGVQRQLDRVLDRAPHATFPAGLTVLAQLHDPDPLRVALERVMQAFISDADEDALDDVEARLDELPIGFSDFAIATLTALRERYPAGDLTARMLRRADPRILRRRADTVERLARHLAGRQSPETETLLREGVQLRQALLRQVDRDDRPARLRQARLLWRLHLALIEAQHARGALTNAAADIDAAFAVWHSHFNVKRDADTLRMESDLRRLNGLRHLLNGDPVLAYRELRRAIYLLDLSGLDDANVRASLTEETNRAAEGAEATALPTLQRAAQAAVETADRDREQAKRWSDPKTRADAERRGKLLYYGAVGLTVALIFITGQRRDPTPFRHPHPGWGNADRTMREAFTVDGAAVSKGAAATADRSVEHARRLSAALELEEQAAPVRRQPVHSPQEVDARIELLYRLGTSRMTRDENTLAIVALEEARRWCRSRPDVPSPRLAQVETSLYEALRAIGCTGTVD